jgi:transposase
LHKLISSGTAPARKLNRARILLKVDVGKHAEAQALSDRQIALMLETSTATVQRARERFYEGGLQAALERSKPDRLYKRSLEGRAEAHLIALACSEPPRGRNRWSLRLLWRTKRWSWASWRRSRMRWCVGHSKKELKPHLFKQWVIPPEYNAQ